MSNPRTATRGWARILVAAVSAIGCASSGAPEPAAGSGGNAGMAGLGGAAGTSGIGGVGGAAGVAGLGGVGGSAGAGGNGGAGGAGSVSGQGGDGGAFASNRVAPDQVCQRLAEIQCGAETRCCTDTTRRHATEDACVDAQRGVCENVFKVAIVGADPRTGFSMDLAQHALDTFEAKSQRCALDAQSWGASADGLLTMFGGTRGNGQSCQPMSETDFAAGLSCTAGLTCAPSTEIVNLPAGWACRPRASEGGKCFADINCVDGLRCAELNTLSTCAPTFARDAACTRPTECASLVCRHGACADVTQDNVYCLGG